MAVGEVRPCLAMYTVNFFKPGPRPRVPGQIRPKPNKSTLLGLEVWVIINAGLSQFRLFAFPAVLKP